ncbi:MAG: GNAT family N-acetyltransferase [Bdellovibrionales bacterium]|nr:GNAT family N-acetyltransferase [Bdellovibrionales bacterium]
MNSMDVWVKSTDEASTDLKALDLALRAENQGLYGDPERSVFGLVVRAAPGASGPSLLGGAKGIIHWKWFYLTHLWVDFSRRGQGLGGEIVQRLISEARLQGLAGIYVDTFSGDAVRFYQRAGFEVVGQIPQFINGFDRTYLKISLADEDTSR